MKHSPDVTNIMTECLLEHRADFPLLEEASARDCASRHAQLSVNGNEVLDRLLVLLASYFQPQPTSPCSLFPPTLLLSICDTLQLGRLDGAIEQNDASVLPLVLSKLRDWRVLDLEYRFSPGGIHKLALDLAGIIHGRSIPFNLGLNQAYHRRLRVKWVPYDSPCKNQDQELFSTPLSPSSPRSRALDSVQACVHSPSDLGERHSDSTCASSQTRGTPDPEDTSVALRQHPGSGFRSGCSACRHPRVSGPSIPFSSHMTSFEQTTPSFDSAINTCVASSRHRKSSIQHSMIKEPKHGQHMSLHPIAHNEENEPPLPKPMGAPQATGISFPRQRTHCPRISNTLLSQELFSSVQRRELNHLLNRPREGDKHTPGHRVASVDLRLPITGTNHLLRSRNHASPIDFHPRSQVNAHGLGSVVARVPPQSSNQNPMGPRSGWRLPSWSSSHRGRHHHLTATVTAMPIVKAKSPATDSVSPPPRKPKPSVQTLLPIQPTWSRLSSLSILPKIPSDMKRRGRRSIPPTQTYKHTWNDGALPSSPLSARK